jgi:hypothetical protein
MCAPQDIRESAAEGPQSALERKYIQEYLESQDTNLESLGRLPKDEMQRLMQICITQTR